MSDPKDLLDELGPEDADRLHRSIAETEAVSPPNVLRERLMATVTRTNRFADFVESVSKALDVAIERADALLRALDDPGSWEAGPVPVLRIFHVEGGPATDDAITGFIRMTPGSVHPEHRHLARDITVIVQGSYRDSAGSVHRTGDVIEVFGGSHSFEVLPGPDLIFLTVIYEGVELGDAIIGPASPLM